MISKKVFFNLKIFGSATSDVVFNCQLKLSSFKTTEHTNRNLASLQGEGDKKVGDVIVALRFLIHF